MDINLKHETLSLYTPVCALDVSQEFRAESVVPDTMPDIGNILDTDTVVYLRRRSAGEGKVFLEGEIHATLLYLGEDDTLQKIQVQTPCSCTLEAAQAVEEDRVVASLTLIRGEGRMINPRKVSLLAETRAWAEVYRAGSIELTADADGDDLEKLTEERSVPYIAAVESKSFVVSEEFTLPPSSLGIREVLGYDASAAISEQRSLGGKIILQGSAQLELRYMGEEGELCQERFSTPFSQLMDVPDEAEGSAEILLTPEIAYVEVLPGGSGSDIIHLELHLSAQMLYRAERTVTIVSDAYSLHHICKAEQRELTVRRAGAKISLRGSEQMLLELPEPAGSTLFGYVKAGKPERSGGKLRLPVQTHVFYKTQSDTIRSAAKNVVLELREDKTDTCNLRLGTPVVSEPYISLSGGNLEVRISAEVPAVPVEEEQILCISELTVSEQPADPAENAPSLILVRPEGRSMWDLAKTYGSTVARIEKVNTDADAKLLLIPVAR